MGPRKQSRTLSRRDLHSVQLEAQALLTSSLLFLPFENSGSNKPSSTRPGVFMRRSSLPEATGFHSRVLAIKRAFHSSAGRQREHQYDRNNEDDDNPWGDLDKAFENLADKSLYKQVYHKHPSVDATAELPEPSQAKSSAAKHPISEMEEAIFAQAGAAAVKTMSRRSHIADMGAVSGVRFSDAPPSVPSRVGLPANYGGSDDAFGLQAAPRTSAKWSEYMQNSSEDDDSPWSSLDAFVDNPDSSAQFAVPLPLQHQQDVMQLSAQHYNQQDQVPRQQYHEHSSSQQLKINSKEAFAANDDLLRQQLELQTYQTGSLEEAEFARAGAAAVTQLFNDAPVPTRPAADEQNSHRLSHIDPATGSASMVDVSAKLSTSRSATAVGRVYMPHSAAILLRATETQQGISGKGPVLHTAQLAGIMAAKRTAELIPLCHPLPLTHVEVKLDINASTEQADEISWITVECTARTEGQTGVEMEALTGCTLACLTVWDMVKAVAGKTMRIGEIMVVSKRGGKSGDWERSV